MISHVRSIHLLYQCIPETSECGRAHVSMSLAQEVTHNDVIACISPHFDQPFISAVIFTRTMYNYNCTNWSFSMPSPQSKHLTNVVLRKEVEKVIYSYHQFTPEIHESVFVADNVTITGDVTIGEYSSVWFQTVIRGDVAPVRIGKNVNIQDLSCLHQSP